MIRVNRTGEKIVAFSIILSILCSTFVPSLPIIGAEVDQSKWITSGIYQYEILDANKKTAALCRINSSKPNIEIPEIIDGYTIVCLGSYDGKERIDVMGENFLTVNSIIIPKTVKVIGSFAFNQCENIESIVFSETENVHIKRWAFYECNNLTNIALRGSVVQNYCFFLKKRLDRLELNNVLTDYIETYESNFFPAAKTIILKGDMLYRLKEFTYNSSFATKIFINDSVSLDVRNYDCYLTKSVVYVNGRSVNFIGNIKSLENLYTIPSAKVISSAKKAHVTYHVKSTGSMKKVTRKKKGKKYQYSWKPVKTTIKTYKYKGKKKGWKCTKKKATTQYYVYAKKNILDDYQLIQTTKKKKITTYYNYVNVKHVKIWLE